MSAGLFTDAERLGVDEVKRIQGGFELYGTATKEAAWTAGSFAVWTDDPAVQVNAAWPSWAASEAMQFVWRDVDTGASYGRTAPDGDSSPGASLFLPFTLQPGQRKVVALRLAWLQRER